VAEAAVVGKPHDVKGESVFAYVVLRGPRPSGDTSALVKELRDWVGEQLGPIAKPDDVRFADNLPKTRSGKIMRRLLKAIARGEEITQDVSTLENPAILEQLRGTETAPQPRPVKAVPAKPAVAPKRAKVRAAVKPRVRKAARKPARKLAKKAPKKVARKAKRASKPGPKAPPSRAGRLARIARTHRGARSQGQARRRRRR